jgi:hypothetical protein
MPFIQGLCFQEKRQKSLRNDLPKKTLQFNIDGYLSSYCNYPIANNNI